MLFTSAELGHLKCDHGLWLTIANVLASGTVSLLPLISGALVCCRPCLSVAAAHLIVKSEFWKVNREIWIVDSEL